MDRETELSLIDRLREGDEAAFDAIYAAYNGRLLGFVTRLSRSRDVAEELVEETWLRLVRLADRLDPGTRIGAWLFTVARNLHVSYCRSRVIEGDAAVSLSLWPDIRRETPFDVLARAEFEGRIDAALGELPLLLREALRLVGVEQLPAAEAAVICGITAEAMRQRVRRGRVLLAERLNLPAAELRLKTGA